MTEAVRSLFPWACRLIHDTDALPDMLVSLQEVIAAAYPLEIDLVCEADVLS
jgi:hypothetical protein